MPSEREHIKQVIHNIDVVEYLIEKPEFCDWIATTVFYTALHIVEAILYVSRKHGERRHGQNHDSREQILKNTINYEEIWKHYRPMASASIIARYLHGDSGNPIIFQKYMSYQKVKGTLIKEHLGGIVKSAKKFLSSSSASAIETALQKIIE